MGKSSLNAENKDAVINRIKALKPEAEPQWGKMSVNEMMFHCSKVTNLILSNKHSANKPTVKQRFIKLIGLHILKQFPKEVKTSTAYLKTTGDNLDFEAERDYFIETITKAAHYTNVISGHHPFFGPLNTEEWRRFMWMHTDHHLRQFNV